jgi:hypothetical protein
MKLIAGSQTEKINVYDANGNRIPFVKEYNTETKEAQIVLTDSNGHMIMRDVSEDGKWKRDITVVTVTLEGSYAERDGVRI